MTIQLVICLTMKNQHAIWKMQRRSVTMTITTKLNDRVLIKLPYHRTTKNVALNQNRCRTGQVKSTGSYFICEFREPEDT